MEIAPQIKQYILENFMYSDDAGELTDDLSLLDNRIMDSTGVLELVGYIEETFEIQVDDPVSTELTIEPEHPVAVDPVPSPTSLPDLTPPEGWNPYQDPVTGISVYMPEDWIVTGIIEGEYAILQSYPEDKYIGGELLEDGDTKCDLSIRPEGDRAEELIEGWKHYQDSLSMWHISNVKIPLEMQWVLVKSNNPSAETKELENKIIGKGNESQFTLLLRILELVERERKIGF